MSARRIAVLLFPWYVLWRIKQLTDQEVGQVGADRWEEGYFRALWEIRVNLGLVRETPRD